MFVRSWIAVLLLMNYLLVVGMGCVNRPEDQPELVRIQTSEKGHFYQQCRYMRMDGLESFLTESLNTRYQSDHKAPPHHIFTVVSGINAHYLTAARWQLLPPVLAPGSETSLPFSYQLMVLAGVPSAINPPPWRS